MKKDMPRGAGRRPRELKLFGSFAQKAPNKVFVSVVLGALAGMSYSLIIPLVTAVLEPERGQFLPAESEVGVFLSWQISNVKYATFFAAVCLFILVARTASQVILTRVSMDVTTDLRTRMYQRIADAPVVDLERIGHSKLLASVTADVPVIIAGSRLVPDLLTNAVTLLGMLGFLLYLNAAVFWFVMGCILFGVATYQLPMLLGRRYLVRARRHLDDLHESIRGLVHGAKELKLSEAKRAAYFAEKLARHEGEVRDDAKTGHTIMRVALNYGSLITFFVIGAVTFVFVNHHAISRQELNGVVMALLYVTGPIAMLLNFIPQITTARVALRKVEEVFAEIPEEPVRRHVAASRDWRAIRLSGVRYQHRGQKGEEGFLVGPLDLVVEKGKITFIVGGNGSGKSTLSKLITLHYHPLSGDIHFDQTRVDGETITAFRQGIAAIYSDYYLFDRVLGPQVPGIQQLVDGYLKALALDGKVSFEDGRFSTLALSDGQKRRLALLVAFIEDAELYLFDEWAADQDPAFKEIFYRQILPALKAKGKAVVVISHDDRYFHLADKVVVMSEGRVLRVETPSPASAPQLRTGSF
jgi:putative pyoverdin transport system ATP-binding/permease protein